MPALARGLDPSGPTRWLDENTTNSQQPLLACPTESPGVERGLVRGTKRRRTAPYPSRNQVLQESRAKVSAYKSCPVTQARAVPEFDTSKSQDDQIHSQTCHPARKRPAEPERWLRGAIACVEPDEKAR